MTLVLPDVLRKFRNCILLKLKHKGQMQAKKKRGHNIIPNQKYLGEMIISYILLIFICLKNSISINVILNFNKTNLFSTLKHLYSAHHAPDNILSHQKHWLIYSSSESYEVGTVTFTLQMGKAQKG